VSWLLPKEAEYDIAEARIQAFKSNFISLYDLILLKLSFLFSSYARH
jgi:hypothetical protein